MQKSENIDALAKALCKAQAEMVPAVKDSDNPFFKSKYADYSSVWKACHKALTNNGLAVGQLMEPSEKGILLTTIIMHESGQWLSGSQPISAIKQDPQGIGSAITYARRYGLAAILALPQEDDDGEIAMNRSAQKFQGGIRIPVDLGLSPLIHGEPPQIHPQISAIKKVTANALPGDFSFSPQILVDDFILPFGKEGEKGKKLKDLPRHRIESARDWAVSKDKFGQFVDAANAYLKTTDPLNEELPY